LAIIGAGTAGDPMLVPWLIEQMQVTEHARVAGEAFTMITGADLVRDGLKGESPYDFDDDPNDDPEDNNVAMDPDEHLPWPDPQLAAAWWQHRSDAFDNGTRYFLGKTLSAGHLRQVLCTGSQRQRACAAMELALLRPGLPLFETRAPGFRQVRTT
jgi:uncharacterized protein (TIGR02270 family)